MAPRVSGRKGLFFIFIFILLFFGKNVNARNSKRKWWKKKKKGIWYVRTVAVHRSVQPPRPVYMMHDRRHAYLV